MMLSQSQSQRTKAYKKNALGLLVIQILNVGINFLLVPIVIHALGKEEYGIWVVLVTIVGWLGLFDMGLGHGLRNKYAEAKAKGHFEDVKRYVSTAFFVVSGISLAVFLLFMTVFPFVSWTAIFACRETLAPQLNSLILIVIGSFCLRFACSICNSLLLADQKPALSNLIHLSSHILALIVVATMVLFFDTNLFTLGSALAVSQSIPPVLAFFLLFTTLYKEIRPERRYFSKDHVRLIFSLGIRFFMIQLTALILFQTNNFIIAHTCSLNDVAEFNIAYKYIGILQIAFMAILTPLWSASTEAFTRGDTQWIKNAIKKINLLWIMAIFAGILMTVASPWAYYLWLQGSITANLFLLSLCLVYYICLLRVATYRSFMNGTGKIKLQFYVTMIQALLHVPLAVWLGNYYGIAGVLISMIFWQAINCIWEPYQYRLIVSGKARGIWNA